MLDLSTREMQFAVEAARKAAGLAQRVQAGATPMQITKKDFSPVTVADFAAQAVVGRLMADAFPDDPLVGEETAADLRVAEARETLESVVHFVAKIVPEATEETVCGWIDRGAGDPADRFWVLDPLDGTKGYLRGGQYASALALIENGEVQLGVLGCPGLGEGCQPAFLGTGVLVAAVRGQGAWYASLDGEEDWRQLKVSDCANPAEARVLRSVEASHTNTGQLDALITALGTQAEPVLMDSQAKYAVMAGGGGELLFRLLSPKQPDYRERIWDQAAGAIVLEEAGGRITDLAGKPLDFTQGRRLEQNRGVLASNGVLHAKGLEALGQVMNG